MLLNIEVYMPEIKKKVWKLNNKQGLTMSSNVSFHLLPLLDWIPLIKFYTFLFIEPADAASIAVWFK